MKLGKSRRKIRNDPSWSYLKADPYQNGWWIRSGQNRDIGYWALNTPKGEPTTLDRDKDQDTLEVEIREIRKTHQTRDWSPSKKLCVLVTSQLTTSPRRRLEVSRSASREERKWDGTLKIDRTEQVWGPRQRSLVPLKTREGTRGIQSGETPQTQEPVDHRRQNSPH